MTITDLNESMEQLKNAVVQETKSSPSLKQTFFYLNHQNSFIIVSQDQWSKKRLSGLWNAIQDFIYVS